jgi:hypothetical protein
MRQKVKNTYFEQRNILNLDTDIWVQDRSPSFNTETSTFIFTV